MALETQLLILYGPVASLEVSIQAQVTSYLFIAHDLSVVRHIAD